MFAFQLQLFSSKKGVSSSKNGRDSNAKRLGVKRHDGVVVKAGKNPSRSERDAWWGRYPLCRIGRRSSF